MLCGKFKVPTEHVLQNIQNKLHHVFKFIFRKYFVNAAYGIGID